jgi:hypothetical protein
MICLISFLLPRSTCHQAPYFGGFNNTPNYTSKMGFAALKADGSIMAWGNSYFGRKKAPTDSGYTKKTGSPYQATGF